MTADPEIAVLDMEWTAWEGSWKRGWNAPGEFREVVQIGLLVLADTAALPEVRAMQVLVRPVINPELSDYFIELTGLTQAAVERDGLALAEAVGRMRAALGAATAVYSMGEDGEVLRANCARTGVAFDLPAALFRDTTPAIAAFLGEPGRPLISSRLPEPMGFPPPGDAHDALSDCRCIAEAFRIMRADGAF